MVQDSQQSIKYAVSLYLATAGIGGHLLGSDEKEIIYLVFGIIDLQNKEVSDQSSQLFFEDLRRRRSYRPSAQTVCAAFIREIPENLKTCFPFFSLSCRRRWLFFLVEGRVEKRC